MRSDKMFDVIGDTFYLFAKRAGGKNLPKIERFRRRLRRLYIVPLGEWKGKGVKI